MISYGFFAFAVGSVWGFAWGVLLHWLDIPRQTFRVMAGGVEDENV